MDLGTENVQCEIESRGIQRNSNGEKGTSLVKCDKMSDDSAQSRSVARMTQIHIVATLWSPWTAIGWQTGGK